MNTQVHLNPTKLSILSIPRDKYWIFISSILQLLYNESSKTSSGYNTEITDDEDDSDDDSSDIDDDVVVHHNNNNNNTYDDENDEIDTNEIDDESVSTDSNINRKDSINSTQDDSNKSTPHRPSVDNSSKVKSNDSYDNLISNTSSNPSSSHLHHRHRNSNGSQLETSYSDNEDNQDEESNYFFHIALTPLECTIICSTKLMKIYFKNPIKICKSLNYDDVKIIDQNFLSLQVDSDGSFDNSLRILELTKPLSQNNISLFFLSSHFNDIVLIPYIFKEKVINILTKKNFEFSDISNSYIMTSNDYSPLSINSPTSQDNQEYNIDIDEEYDSKILENKTFKLFKQANIKPIINRNVKLLLTGARAGEVNNSILKTAKILSSFDSIPDYFAITRTSINEVSLILPKSTKLRTKMGFDSKNIIGSTQDIIIPITIDFSTLPLDSTGIVAGVASKLINGLKSYNDSTIEMNYFSMARSGIIMIPKENISVISQILNNIDYDGDNSNSVDIPNIDALTI
ncbi:hypothetical protein DFJ63DRAFT_206127 [Scheffersomyces coipomensis]|uniref:uncharacterized protein n=1 Tax=Scheffersomyces coipomensis TaxID=1788519 RepID=UPI00315CBC04